MECKKGEIYLVDWSPARGNEQEGCRPALIIQNDIGNKYSPTTIVAAISTNITKKYPFHVHLMPEESGLNEPSVVKLEHIMTIDKSRLIKKIGNVNVEKIREIERAIHISFGLQE